MTKFLSVEGSPPRSIGAAGSFKSDILISAIIALAIHALLFTLPLSKTMSGTRVPINKPISISIIHPQETVAAVPQVEVSAEAQVQPRSEARSHLSARQTVISKERVTSKKPLTVRNMTVRQSSPEEATKPEPAANRDNQHKLGKEGIIDQMLRDEGKKIGSSPPVKTASISRHILEGNQKGQDIVVYVSPRYKKNPPPPYPKVARQRGYEGRTLLRVEVLENGEVGRIEVAASSGFDVLDTAALRSVEGWTFIPGTRNGKKTREWVTVPIRFSLR